LRDFQRYAKGFFLEDCRINVVFLYAGEKSLASFGVIKVSLSLFFSFFAILHLRVLDCVGGADVVFAAAVPPCTTIFFDVRVISRDRDEEVNCANDDYHGRDVGCDVCWKSLLTPETEGVKFVAADFVVIASDGVVAGLETGLVAVLADVRRRTFAVENCQDEDWDGEETAQRHPRHVNDVAQSKHDSIRDSATNVVRLLSSEEMSPRRSRGKESNGEENAGKEDHPNADTQHHSLDQCQGDGPETFCTQ
jgi:hypothetical protein